MRTAVWIALSALLLAVLTLPAACREDVPACYEGDHTACTCAENRLGYQSCLAGEAKYGPCVCDGKTPGLDGSFEDLPDGSSAPDGMLPFMSKCTANEQCESGNCHTFSQEGSFCTKSCEDTADCPAPSSGCNNRKICKAP